MATAKAALADLDAAKTKYSVSGMLWVQGESDAKEEMGKDYKKIVFDKHRLTDDPILEWVTPGHPLFECVRELVLQRTQNDLRRGAVFYDLNRRLPARLDVFSAAIKDGQGEVLNRRLFVVETTMDGTVEVRSVHATGSEELHNLVVDDFHTYFVTDAKLLTHDNTIREPTTAVVPGLAGHETPGQRQDGAGSRQDDSDCDTLLLR